MTHRELVDWLLHLCMVILFAVGILLLVVLVDVIRQGAHSQEIATSDPALICGKVDGMSYSRQHRKLLLEDERKADFARYGVPWSEHRGYELDHVVPLDLGGADTPQNRRPQRCAEWQGYRCVDGQAADKDQQEWMAAQQVCEIYRHDPTWAADRIKQWQAIFANWKDW